ncbi:MAG: 4-demethylwyosine synthase TYW1 [archaeon]
MLEQRAKDALEDQHYRLVGSHSAVKVCGWTKKHIKGEGACYKWKFYGIVSAQCMQMTTSLSCANRCVFCWRSYNAPVAKEWIWPVDDPHIILEESKKAHHQLLVGIKGNKKTLPEQYAASKTVQHVALSLTGEPIMYPLLNDFLERCNAEHISTFLVTNAQYPERIKQLKPVTQLYLSIDAPNKTMLKKIDIPLFSDYWERCLQSLAYTKEKKHRTCVRLTMIKHMNMIHPEEYAELIHKAMPDFVEIKSYMFIGASRQRLSLENMPFHEEIRAFSAELLKQLPDYALVAEHKPSRVVLLAKKTFFRDGRWHTWIDFEQWHKLTAEGKDVHTDDYLLPTKLVMTRV